MHDLECQVTTVLRKYKHFHVNQGAAKDKQKTSDNKYLPGICGPHSTRDIHHDIYEESSIFYTAWDESCMSSNTKNQPNTRCYTHVIA